MIVDYLIKDYKSSEDLIKELTHLADALDMTCDRDKIKDADNIRKIINLYITEKNWNKIISEKTVTKETEKISDYCVINLIKHKRNLNIY